MANQTAGTLTTLATSIAIAITAGAANARDLSTNNGILRSNPDIADTMRKAKGACDAINGDRRAYIQCVGDTQRALVILGDLLWEGTNNSLRRAPTNSARRKYQTAKRVMTSECVNPLKTPKSGSLERVMPILLPEFRNCLDAMKSEHLDLNLSFAFLFQKDDYWELLRVLEQNVSQLEKTPIPARTGPKLRKI